MGMTIAYERLNTEPCGFLSFTDDGKLTWCNRTLVEMLGFEVDEVTGQHIERLFTVGSRIFYQTHWFPLLRLHGHAEEIFLMLLAKSGDHVGALVNAVRQERNGAVEYDCVVMRVRERQKYEDELLSARRTADEARAEVELQKQELQNANDLLETQAVELELQQEQLQEQALELEAASEELTVINQDLLARTEEAEHLRVVAEEANRAKSTFLAVMSHELRTPLNAIGGYVQILEMGIHGAVTEAQLETLDRIDRSQRHLLGLINEVLNLARIESGRVEYVIEAVPVEDAIAAVVPMVQPQLENKGVGFEVELTPGLVAGADREKVQQILLNLLGNAVKFTPAGGSVRVEADHPAETGGRLAIRICDTGIGIPTDKLNSIFEPFVQVETSRASGEEGTGLGLAISRDLARGMSGDLTAASVVGQGSVFTLTLPVAHGNE
ncbi:MAG: ATP-binding protein [Gemmatimonadota bacterium]